MSLPMVDGPTDVPALRDWVMERTKPTGTLRELDGRFIHAAMTAAKLWWVEEATCHLLAESAPTWPTDAVLDMTDLPTMAGFAVLEHDIIGTDAARPDHEVRVSAICWGPVNLPPLDDGAERLALGIGMFTRVDLHKGLSGEDLQRTAPTLAALMDDIFPPDAKPGDRAFFTDAGPERPETLEVVGHVDRQAAEVVFHDPTGTGELTSSDQIEKASFYRRGTLYAYIGRTDWEHGRGVEGVLPDSPRRGPDADRSMTEDRRLLAALWAITRTPVVTTVRTRPPRHVARRSERKGRDATVQVLRLGGPHRENITTGEPNGRDWKHSWVVGPHFRWQAHGPGWSERKLILVGPYTKGPADKPLLGAERVWRVVPPPTTSVSR